MTTPDRAPRPQQVHLSYRPTRDHLACALAMAASERIEQALEEVGSMTPTAQAAKLALVSELGTDAVYARLAALLRWHGEDTMGWPDIDRAVLGAAMERAAELWPGASS